MALIELRDASVWLDGCEILKSLSWQLGCGAHCAVMGANGSGKSAFLRLISGRIWPRQHTSRRAVRVWLWCRITPATAHRF